MYVASLNFKTSCFAFWGGGHVTVGISLFVFAIVSVSITVVLSTHLCVLCSHFIHQMSLFQGHVTCRILPWQALVNVWTVCQKSGHCGGWALVEVWLYNVLTFVANKIMYPREKSKFCPTGTNCSITESENSLSTLPPLIFSKTK